MQFGSQVRPELGRTDYTAFLQGANQGSAAIGRGIAALGQGAAIGLQQYYQKKEEKQLLDQTRNRATQFITENPDFAKMVGITDPKDPKAIDAMIKGVGGGDIRRGAMMANQAISQFSEQKRQMDEAQKEQAALRAGAGYFKTTEDPAGALDAYAQAGGRNPQALINFTNAYAQVLGASPRAKPEMILSPEQVQEYQARGMKVEGVPMPDGRIMAKGVSTISPSQRPVLSPEEEALKTQQNLRIEGAYKANEELIKAGGDARKLERDADQAIRLLDNVKTGKGEQFFLDARKLAKTFGFEIGDVKDAEQIRTLFGNFVMDRILQTKGAVSDKEMQLFSEYSANYGNTPEGNKQILQFAKGAYKRSSEISRMIRDMRKQGKDEFEINLAVEDYQDKNPISLKIPSVFEKADSIIQG